ncbi:DUF1804 family protein [Providencia rettgeri]|nr:hypothetical protein CSC14_2979 [Proteus mirabilis]
MATAIDVIQRFGQFISDKYPQHNVVFVEILEAFAEELERAYG